MYALTVIYLLCAVGSVVAIDLTAKPSPVPLEPRTLVEEQDSDVKLLFNNCSGAINITIGIVQGIQRTLSFPQGVLSIPCNASSLTINDSASVKLHPIAIGFITLSFNDAENGEKYLEYPIGVIRPPRQPKDLIFVYGIIVLSIFNTFCFGMKLDLEKVKKYVKKPVAPAIGMICQFMLMPMIAFTLTRIIQKHPAQELGVFATGVAPGGGASNVWTYALGGDIDLSITMTFLSSFAALGFVPLWMYTLGRYIMNESDEGKGVALPFGQMALTLTYITVPVVIGLLANKFLPKFCKIILKAQKVMIAITIMFAVGMGIYSNIYAFKLVLFDYQLLLATMTLPWLGFLFGFLVGLFTMKKKEIAVTIGIETAVQNTNIATILLRTSLVQPWGDISTAVPILLNLFVPIPFYFILAGRIIYFKCFKKADSLQVTEEKKKEGGENPAFESDVNDDPLEKKNEKCTEL